MATTVLTCSPFYIACRTNNIDKVKELLISMTVNEINRIEPNGSTALHAAAFYGHAEIVELLLQAGAWRSIKNKHQLNPMQEAKTSEIKKLFRRRDVRFLGDFGTDDEWLRVTDEADVNAAILRDSLRQDSVQSNIVNALQTIWKSYIKAELTKEKDIQLVDPFFEQAVAEGNPEMLIRAYTAQTGFYSALNRQLATSTLYTDKSTPGRDARRMIAAIITHDPLLGKYSFLGKTYRGLKMTEEDLQQYQVGSLIMTKSFSSTSKDLSIALTFLKGDYRQKQDGTLAKFSAMCIYNIKNARSSLDIHTLSEYDYEQEVLIMPYTAFRVIDIKINPTVHADNGVRAEIQLDECEECVQFAW